MRFTHSYIILLAVLLFLPIFSHAESFLAFQAYGMLKADGGLQVKEKFIYDYGNEWKHGIVRSIPAVSPDGKLLSLWGFDAYDKVGQIGTSVDAGGNVASVRIGDSNKTVNGSQYYQLFYAIDGAARKNTYTWTAFPSTKENVEKFSAQLMLPPELQNLPKGEVTADCILFKANGATSSCAMVPNMHLGRIIYFSADQENLKSASVVITLNYPKGIIATPSIFTARGKLIAKTVCVTLAFTGLSFALFLSRKKILNQWRKFTKMRSKAEHFSFLARSVSERGVIDEEAVIATVADLADRGYLSLDPQAQPAGLGEFIDYSITPTTNEGLDGAEMMLLEVFETGISSLSDWLRNEFVKQKSALESSAREDLNDHILSKTIEAWPRLVGFRHEI